MLQSLVFAVIEKGILYNPSGYGDMAKKHCICYRSFIFTLQNTLSVQYVIIDVYDKILYQQHRHIKNSL